MKTAVTSNHSHDTRTGDGAYGPTAGSEASRKAGGRMGHPITRHRSFASGLLDSGMRRPLLRPGLPSLRPRCRENSGLRVSHGQ